MIPTLALMALVCSEGETVNMKFVSNGVTAKVGHYRPSRAEMNSLPEKKPEAIKTTPPGLQAAKYGAIHIGEKEWSFLLDEPEGKPARLYLDTNGDGDLTNDPPTTWEPNVTEGLTMYQGYGQVDLEDGNIGTLGLYRFDAKDPKRAQLKNTLMFYTDYGYEVTFVLDGKSFTTFLSGSPQPTSTFWIDRDENKRPSYKREMAQVGKPFNFTGTTYEIKLEGQSLKLDKAKETLAIAPMPPDIEVGKKAIPFVAVAMDGTKIDFPKSYAGKIVMLDFWATWCGPCIAELPNVKKAYHTWHDKGFDVLGISFDNQDMTEKLNTFIKENELPWRQIYEGKGWETSLGETYDVSSIPFVLLVDGDSGEILATESQLRGPGLSDLVGEKLSRKNETAK